MNIFEDIKNQIFNNFCNYLLACVALLLFSFCHSSVYGANDDNKVTIFMLSDASDKALEEDPIVWAIGELDSILKDKDLKSQIRYNLLDIHESGIKIVVTPGESSFARSIARGSNIKLPESAESLAIINGTIKNEKVIMISGSDVRGLVYGILELADRVKYCDNPMEMLDRIDNSVDQPHNSIRSMTRLFVSDIEDKSWFYDKKFWESYLSMLINQRFNRFSLTLGLGYDSPKEVLDSYFIFAYPYLVKVPGYDVKVRELKEGEREQNLEMLKFIGSEASKRGLHFQLGLWGHAYECVNSPNVNYHIDGLTNEIHAEYCQNAVRILLQNCPDIDGITFRAHYESGIPDGSKSFWETVFQGVAECGRRVEMDLHAKGISYEQIGMALRTGLPVFVSPKYTAEHMGLPAHQGAMREQERKPSPNASNPRNSIARYGYSDFLSDERDYGVYFRMWPGKQKILIWGDPAMASAYGRFASFCGSLGLEVCEPLCFKGRQGSGISAERRVYADDSLIPEGGNWQKYLYTYRIWGRHLYNPDCDPESYRRFLRYEFGAAAGFIEKALANSSRVLPLITSAHLPAGSAMTYWPEMYTNMPITNSGISHPYGDTPRPKVFGRVSPLDPAMFSPVNEFVDDLLSDEPSSRYSPADIARWLENFALVSKEQLSLAKEVITDYSIPAFRRFSIDIQVQNELGLFFAQKLRAAISFEFYEKTADPNHLHDAIYFYTSARDAWMEIIKQTTDVYVENLGFGQFPHIRGHWRDRLPAIDEDLNQMKEILKEQIGKLATLPLELTSAANLWLKSPPSIPDCEHKVPEKFYSGKPLDIKLISTSNRIHNVKLHYRHVNQVEEYNIVNMAEKNGVWHYTIPEDFTETEYHLMYFFEIIDNKENGWFFPGYEANLANQPYYNIIKEK